MGDWLALASGSGIGTFALLALERTTARPGRRSSCQTKGTER
jgi:hypothetical protein